MKRSRVSATVRYAASIYGVTLCIIQAVVSLPLYNGKIERQGRRGLYGL